MATLADLQREIDQGKFDDPLPPPPPHPTATEPVIPVRPKKRKAAPKPRVPKRTRYAPSVGASEPDLDDMEFERAMAGAAAAATEDGSGGGAENPMQKQEQQYRALKNFVSAYPDIATRVGIEQYEHAPCHVLDEVSKDISGMISHERRTKFLGFMLGLGASVLEKGSSVLIDMFPPEKYPNYPVPDLNGYAGDVESAMPLLKDPLNELARDCGMPEPTPAQTIGLILAQVAFQRHQLNAKKREENKENEAPPVFCNQ
jgi:hypothetical protein